MHVALPITLGLANKGPSIQKVVRFKKLVDMMVVVSLGSNPPGVIRGNGPLMPKNLQSKISINIICFIESKYLVLTGCWLDAN